MNASHNVTESFIFLYDTYHPALIAFLINHSKNTLNFLCLKTKNAYALLPERRSVFVFMMSSGHLQDWNTQQA